MEYSIGILLVRTLAVSNSGAGTGVIDSVAVNTSSPPAFQLLNLPAFPASVPPSQQLRFAVRFSPQQPQAFSGSLLVSVNGHILTINLQGQVICRVRRPRRNSRTPTELLRRRLLPAAPLPWATPPWGKRPK